MTTNETFPLRLTMRAWLPRFVVLVMLACATCVLRAQGFERMSEVEAELYADKAYVNADYETMKQVRSYWQKEVKRLHSMRQFEFALTGSSDAVLKVTIPARLLFNQNDSTMLNSAEGLLRPFLRLVRGNESLATLIVAAYTDNNGSDGYLMRLSSGRANALHRWFARQGVGPADLRSFGFANRVPRTANRNIRERERNRRVSLYFVPNKRMLKLAKKGEIN